MSNQHQTQTKPASQQAHVSGKPLDAPLGIMREHMRRMELHDFNGAGSLLSRDFQFTGVTPTPVDGEKYVQLHRELLAGFPDWNYNFKFEREDGNIVRGTVAISGTHTGTINPTFMPGVPPITATGKKVKLPKEMLTITVRNGLISKIDVEKVPNGGVTGILSQLGVHTHH
jgi:hypothetical protein